MVISIKSMVRQCLPKPLHRPVVFQGGNSKDARRMAGRVTDCLFMNGNTNKGFKEIMDDSISSAIDVGRDPKELKFGANGFCIVRDTVEEATETLRDNYCQCRCRSRQRFW